jgi:uncharacterized membrane protein (UPF0182 family)
VSELFDEDPRNTVSERPPGRSRALVITAVVLVIAFFGLTTFSNFYTERLWFQDGGFGSVFSTLLWTRIGLFLVFGVVMASVVAANIVIAFRLRPLFHPPSPEQTGLDRYRQAVTPIRTWLVVGVAVLLGIFAGTSGAGEWRNYLLWRNRVPFGQKDAYFERDIGFYVFELPWMHYVVDVVMAVAIVSLLAAAVVHYLYGGIRLQTPGDRLTGAAQAQLSVLLGVFVLAKAADYWLDRYDLVHQQGSLLTGITYTDDNAVLPAKSILMGIALICAVLFFLNVWRRTWLLPSLGLALLVLSAILLGLIWPGIVQQFQVKPTEADKERPFIEKNIEATRQAYDIDDVQEDSLSPGEAAATLAGLAGGVSTVPLVDPQLVRQTFEQNQQARAYYTVPDILDVDRYEIAGQQRALVVGVRELFQDGINNSDQNWLNLHTVYTHGNGIIAAYANQRDRENRTPQDTDADDDRTQWAEGNAANQTDLAEAVGGFEDRVYFGERSPEYSVVGKASDDAPAVELNLRRSTRAAEPTEQPDGETPPAAEGSEGTTTYDGAGGVPINSMFRELLYAIRFGSTNFLLSGRVHDNSEVLYHRDPAERVRKVAPWLTLDDDVFPTIIPGEGDEEGRVVWVIDGYTTTDRFPGSERESFQEMTDDAFQEDTGLRTLPTDEINYVRNAVKATVDAYDGTVTLYEWDESDPILKAWSSAFPDTVLPKSQIPEELMPHLRYPEDLFKVQRYQLAKYHVTEAGDFYQGNDRWEVPEDPNESSRFQPPYRMFIDEPAAEGEETPAAGADPEQAWSLTSVFVPFDRRNLAAFVSVDSDATSDTYGQIRTINVLNDQTQGPGQVANAMRSDSVAAGTLAEFNRSGNTVSYGNVLTLPVAGRLLNVEPVYVSLAGSSGSYPTLRYVLVSYNESVGIGETLIEALGAALGVDPTDPTEPPTDPGNEPGPDDPGPGTGTPEEQIAQLLLDAQAAFDEAEAAYDEGDLGGYQDKVEEARDLIAQALEIADENGLAPSDAETPAAEETPAG